MSHRVKTNPTIVPLSSTQKSVETTILDDDQSCASDSCAGSGKSHTAAAVAQNYDDSVESIPFGRTLADTEAKRFEGNEHINVLNFHRRGRKMLGNVQMDSCKVLSIADKINGEKANAIAELVKCFKTEGVGVYDKALTPDEVAVKYSISEERVDEALEALETSDKDRKNIDFEDMLRFPVLGDKVNKLEGLIVLDEVQDYTPLSWSFLKTCLTTKDSHTLMIGDPSRQCLMAFAGADPKLFGEMSDFYGCVSKTLPVNRRCSKAVVENAPFKGDMVALDSAPQGSVSTRSTGSVLDEICNGLYEHDAVLSEANLPLIKLGINLLTKGVPVRMRTDKLEKAILRIAYEFLDTRKTKLGEMATKLGAKISEYEAQGADVSDQRELLKCVDLLETYCLANGIAKTTFKRGYGRAKWLPVHPIFQALEKLAGGDHGITLMTGHTAKGLEWNTVFHLEGKMKPAKQQWQVEQSQCLAHVIATRAITHHVTLVD